MNEEDTKWYEYHYNILAMARHLHDNLGCNLEQILYMMEKPWKYSTEWKELQSKGEEE